MHSHMNPQSDRPTHDDFQPLKPGWHLNLYGTTEQEKKKQQELDQLDRKYTLSVLHSLLRR